MIKIALAILAAPVVVLVPMYVYGDEKYILESPLLLWTLVVSSSSAVFGGFVDIIDTFWTKNATVRPWVVAGVVAGIWLSGDIVLNTDVL